MALRMTSEEYEKQFGVKPDVGSSTQTASLSPEKPKKKGFIDTALDAGSAVSKFIGAEGISEQFGADIARATAPKEAKSFVDYPSEKKVLGSALQTGALFAPGAGAGAGMAAKVGAGAATGYAMDVGAGLQEDEDMDEVFNPGVGTAVGAALPIIGGIIGNFPKAMERANLRMTPAERINLKKNGKDVADYLARKKIIGSPEQRFAKIDTLYDKMEDVIEKDVAKANIKYPKSELIAKLQEVPEQFADDPAGFSQAQNAVDEVIKTIQAKAPAEVPGNLIQTYKRKMWKRAYSKTNADVVNETNYAVGSLFKDILDNNVKGLERLNGEYAKLLTARKVLFKATERPETGFMSKLAGSGAGAALGSLAGPVGAAVGAVTGPAVGEKVFGTATRSAAGATVQVLKDALSHIPTDKAGNLQISQKALILLLQDALK